MPNHDTSDCFCNLLRINLLMEGMSKVNNTNNSYKRIITLVKVRILMNYIIRQKLIIAIKAIRIKMIQILKTIKERNFALM